MLLAHVPSWLADRKALNENKMTRCIYILRARTLSVSRWLSAIRFSFMPSARAHFTWDARKKTGRSIPSHENCALSKMCYRVMWCSSFSIKISCIWLEIFRFSFLCVQKNFSIAFFCFVFFPACDFKTDKRSAMNEGERMQKSTRKIEVGR